jgi:pyrimidine deaminase RibD-like protein
MPVAIRDLSEFLGWYNGIGTVIGNLERDRLFRCIAKTVFLPTEKGGLWNTIKATGSCRATAIGLNALLAEEIVSGYSVKNSHHAEQEIMTNTGHWNGNFLTMYVDIQPCSNGKYNGHPQGCRTLLANQYATGNVWYAFSENAYQSGELTGYLKSFEKQDQIVKLRSMTGFPM